VQKARNKCPCLHWAPTPGPRCNPQSWNVNHICRPALILPTVCCTTHSQFPFPLAAGAASITDAAAQHIAADYPPGLMVIGFSDFTLKLFFASSNYSLFGMYQKREDMVRLTPRCQCSCSWALLQFQLHAPTRQQLPAESLERATMKTLFLRRIV
jgi:hypothetical protein